MLADGPLARFFSADERILAAQSLLTRLSSHDSDLHDHSLVTGITAAQILCCLAKSNAQCARAFLVGILHDICLPDVGAVQHHERTAKARSLRSRIQHATREALCGIAPLAALADDVASVHSHVMRSSVIKAVVVADQYDVLTRSWSGAEPLCTSDEAIGMLKAAPGGRYDRATVAALEMLCALEYETAG